jgi:HEPN domain-containing protein
LKNGYNLDAMYLAGYVVECALKALILRFTPEQDQAAKLIQLKTHKLEKLVVLLRELGHPIPLRLVERIRRSDWSTELRYEVGRIDTGETRGYLKTVRIIYRWVEGQLP